MSIPLPSESPANGEWRMANGPAACPAPDAAPPGKSCASPPPPAVGHTELTILPDGTVYAHNLTPALARVLRLLNPADDSMRQRAGDEVSRDPPNIP